ncbi:MAG: FAD-dependent oxidoreductase [Oscillospiraceae bacterium]|nr:FAD-dependent oxidoreductase [Oscillospiraceae bacterium]MBQ7130264.1 FAD-dependent oxidoreductase [Oscillospiraceae bacterium]
MNNLYDVIIIGGGPAGLTAAIYLARAKYRTLVVEKENFGGQITITHEVVNYPGVFKTSGKELTETMRAQAESFGAEFMVTEVENLELSGDIKTVQTARGELKAFGVLLATGAHPRMVGFKGEADFRGRGVAYCATCDGEFFTGKEVFVVGGGFAAAEEAVFLTKYARHVTILIRRDDFSCARSAADAARNHPKITVLTNTEVEEVSGDSSLKAIRYRNNKTGQVSEYRDPAGQNIGVFVFAGYSPATSLAKGLAELNEQGYVVTDRNMKTNIDGLYAAGDVCVKNLRQVVTAVADGAIAATELEKYAAKLHEKTGLHPAIPEPEAKKEEAPAPVPASESSSLFDAAMLSQLNTVFSRMENPLVLKLSLDEREVSRELQAYMEELAGLTHKLTVDIRQGGEEAPCVTVCRADGTETGLAFHGVPGGHEFTSFVLGLYNAAGPGQPLDAGLKADIAKLPRHDMKVLVSLSCTMCPDLVLAAQRIAAENENITAEVYDLNHFPKLRDAYNVMSVPCLVIDDGKTVTFGKKNVYQLMELLK